MRFKPDMYVKDILSIDYDKLKNNGIKVLLFDFDNTLIAHKVHEIDKSYLSLVKSLKKDFKVIILSNSFNSKKLNRISQELDLDFIGYSLKPLSFGYRRLKLSNKKIEIAMIGDQLITDVWGAKRMGYFSILIDPINRDSEIFVTKINRGIEEFIMKKKDNIKRGEYYD